MVDDDAFTPNLGKVRTRHGRHGKRYLNRVLKAAALAGDRSLTRGPGMARFDGSRIGRGAGVGRVLSQADRWASFRARRVVVKTRIVKLAGRGTKGAQLHLRYIQRDGVTREGRPGELYNADYDRADGKAFLERSDGDRHQFRFIVAAEDAVEYEDLKDVTRRFMRQMEADLGTRLDWVAVDHFNTGHPHTHIILRGKDEGADDLVIARDYIAHGMRERAAEIVTLDLGPRTDLEIEQRLQSEVDQERFTGIDWNLKRDATFDGLVSASVDRNDDHARLHQALRAGRLQKLGRLGLAEEVSPGRWRLADDLEPRLRQLGERGDIIKAMHQALKREGLARSAADLAIYDAADGAARRIVGRVVDLGLSDEFGERRSLILDCIDGRVHHIDIGKADIDVLTQRGAVVAVAPIRAAPRTSDKTIAEIAEGNHDRYTIEAHLRYDPSSSEQHAEAHVRRLEALRRAGIVERQVDGTWVIPSDYLDRAARHEHNRVRSNPVSIEVLSPVPLKRQIGADATTWLDRELIHGPPEAIRDAGFGREVRSALAARRQWLIAQSLAEEQVDRTVYRSNLLAILRKRELVREGGRLSEDLQKPYIEHTGAGRVEGVYRRHVDLVSGRFALIEKSREFTLVPWRPILERNLGKPVAGIARGGTISWTLTRQRGGPGVA